MAQEREPRGHKIRELGIRLANALARTRYVGFPSPIWPEEPPALRKETKKQERLR